MGLDQYAYVAAKAGQQSQFYETAVFDKDIGEMVNPKVTRPREIAYWRKHPNLQGWMQQLWIKKGCESDGDATGDSFNGVELELTWEDLDDLERAVTHGQLPETTGFFFGNPADEIYQDQDLEFIRNARAELFLGLKVFYNSSW